MESNNYNYNFIDNLLINPYNYIISFTDYVYLPDLNKITNVINDTIELSMNDINSMSISDITINNINNVIYEYKIFISFMILMSIFSVYVANKLIDNYIIKLTEEEKYKRYKNMININTLKIINSLDNTNIQENQKMNVHQQQLRTKGLFIDSILEINANNNKIIEKIKVKVNDKDNYYYALLRIKLKHNIILKNTNVNLNNINFKINKDKDKDNDTLKSNDMYMIIRFNYNYKNEDTNIKISHIIVNVMNYLNYLTKDQFKNEDFVVLAISKDTQSELNSNEFYNSLKNINYNLCNVKHLTLDSEKKIGFILLLPLKQIYDLFLDVYNDIIFESTSYKIDYDNNECWYNNSLNEVLM